MKIFQIIALSLFISGCAVARSSTAPVTLDVVGESLPTIRHINDMKMKGDTLFFVYEGEDGYGQRLLRINMFLSVGNQTEEANMQ